MNVSKQDRQGFVILSACLFILSATKDLCPERQMLRFLSMTALTLIVNIAID